MVDTAYAPASIGEKHSTDSMQFMSKYQGHSLQNEKKNSEFIWNQERL